MTVALLGVSDKTGLVEFARGLHDCGVELIATNGTRAALQAAGISSLGTRPRRKSATAVS